MIAYLKAEAGGEIVRASLLDGEAQAFAHVVNVAEVFYHFHRLAESKAPGTGQTEAEAALARLEAVGIEFVDLMDAALWQDAARLKSEFVRVSLADCFGVALARRLGGEFLTSDRHELEALATAGAADFTFIR